MSISQLIETCLQQLYNKLSLLENAITFTHSGVVHPSVVDPSYLLEKLVEIEKEIDFNVPYHYKLLYIHLLKKSIILKHIVQMK